MPDTTLLMLLNDVRGKTLRLLEGISEAEAKFSPPGLYNTVLWHAGHALVIVEQLGVAIATGKPAQCPEGWVQMFGWQSQPATITQWPAAADVTAELRAQQLRFTPILQGMTPEQLDRVLPNGGGTVRHSIVHGLHDEACHQGEMWLLRKVWKSRG